MSYTYGTSTASNNNGRVTQMTDGPGQENYTYDSLGRVTQVQKKIYNVTYTTSYTYNLGGQVATMSYPSGRVVRNEYDAIGRVENVKNHTTSAVYASGAAYNAASQLTGFSYGNSVAASFGYSADRLQMTSLAYTLSSNTLLSLTYSYSFSGANNGQIAGITDNVVGGRTASYTYDHLHRLKTAGTTGGGGYNQWGLSWTYDRYGNREAQSVTAGSGPSNDPSYSTSTNRITGLGGYTFSYDANGNLTEDDLYKYKEAETILVNVKYDAENRLVEIRTLASALVATYAFDGHSLRVIKVVGSDRTWYLYDGTQVISEFEDAASNTYTSATPGTMNDTYATFLYQHADHLTSRLTTDQSGDISNQQAHYPYGESWYATGTADPSVLRKFTSYEKDGEVSTGKLNYAIHRTQSSRVGRFITPDPLQGDTSAPQRLNRYSYVGGDPISRSDPLGLEWCDFYGVLSASERLCESTRGGSSDGSDRGFGGGGGTRGDTKMAGTPPFWGGGTSVGGGGLPLGDLFRGARCAGTTDCSYYGRECDIAKSRIPLFLVCGFSCAGDVAAAIAYYCGAAPEVCRNTPNRPWANCVRNCLQVNDNCNGVTLFASCQARLHVRCFSQCAVCKILG